MLLNFQRLILKRGLSYAIKRHLSRCKMNEIVKHRNELNDFELGKFSPNQANLLVSCL